MDVLYDDRDERPGAKFATADLIGVPWQILVGPKGLAEGKVELKRRSDGSREMLSLADVAARFFSETGRGLCRTAWHGRRLVRLGTPPTGLTRSCPPLGLGASILADCPT